MAREWGINTIAVHAGREVNPTRSVAPPIFQTAVFELEDAAAGARFAQAVAPTEYYTRWGNPTTRHAEEIIAALEGGERALVLSSGMAAIATAVLACVRSGDHIVAGRSLYAATMELFRHTLPRLGIEVTFVPPTDPENFRRALRPNTTLIYVETPSNPRLDLTDLEAVARLAREHGVFTIADNTFATPYNQRPLRFGIDAVVHSATKYLAGHGDVLGGLVVCRAEFLEILRALGRTCGPVLGAFESYLTVRGIKTFALRVERQCANARTVAEWLKRHPRIERLHYPGDPAHPDAATVSRLLPEGLYGGMISFEIRDAGREEVFAFMDRLRLIVRATSLGDVHTMILYPAMSSHRELSPQQRQRMGIGDNLVRLSVGIEAAEDILEDLEQALS